MMTVVTVLLALVSVGALWRAIVLVKAAREEIATARSNISGAVALYKQMTDTVAALDDREARIVEQVANMRVELSELQSTVQVVSKNFR